MDAYVAALVKQVLNGPQPVLALPQVLDGLHLTSIKGSVIVALPSWTHVMPTFCRDPWHPLFTAAWSCKGQACVSCA